MARYVKVFLNLLKAHGYKRLALAMLLGLIFLPGCREKEEKKESPLPAVSIEVVQLADHERRLKTTGVVEPWKKTGLGFQVPGKILKGPPEEGTVVPPGSELARLDDSGYRAQRDMTYYQLELAQVDCDRNKADLERYEKLFAEGAISPKEIEDARLMHRAAEAKRGQAESALAQAELAVRHSILKAPFSGTVLKRLCETGEVVAAGTPVLVLSQVNPVKVTLTVPVNEIEFWEKGTKATITPNGNPAEKRANKHRTMTAIVHNVSPGAEAATGSFKVELAVENPAYELRPGQVVGVQKLVKTEKGFWAPLKSVISRGEELKYVFVLDKGENIVKYRQVELGPVVEDRVLVVKGLKNGEKLVVMMPENLRDGNRVEVKTNGHH